MPFQTCQVCGIRPNSSYNQPSLHSLPEEGVLRRPPRGANTMSEKRDRRYNAGLSTGAGLVLLLLASLLPCRLGAQSFTASLEGTVTDPTGAGVPNAALILENQETAIKQARQSDSHGYFLFTLVPPGPYKLTVTATGFQSFERKDMQLQVQQRANVD